MRGNEIKLPFDPQEFCWPHEWHAIPSGFEEDAASSLGYMETFGTDETPANNFVDELRRELCAEHVLFCRRFVAIACSIVDPDDILFYTDDPVEPFAVVHLTWHAERTASYPWCKTYPTIDAFIGDCAVGNKGLATD